MRIRVIIIECVLIAGLFSAVGAWGINANPLPVKLMQPDGTPITLRVHGDEYFHWREDMNGYTVVVDNGVYVYATLDATGRLSPTPWAVGKVDPAGKGLAPKILPSGKVQETYYPNSPPMKGTPEKSATGTRKNLVVLCMFSDHTLADHTRPAADYEAVFNTVGGDPSIAPSGSVRDYYLEDSYGQLTMESTIVEWVTLPHEEAYYAASTDGLGGTYPNSSQGMVEDALNLVDPLVDFSEFDQDEDGYIDAIDIIHSGYAAETGGGEGNWIWSHKGMLWQISPTGWTSAEGVKVFDYHTEAALWATSGQDILRIGVVCHETGHFLGLPDLYDTDSTPGEGIGSWGLMANSWGFDFTQYHPPHNCAWSKIRLGWMAATLLDTPGTYSLDQLETTPVAYRIDKNFPPNEYLLVENRQPAGFETDIPHGGLVVFHIDDTAGYNTQGYPGQEGWPLNGNHYRVAVLQADGDYDLEKGYNRGDSGDPYYSGGVDALTSMTTPNTDAYQIGNAHPTDLELSQISIAGSAMSFFFGTGDDLSFSPREHYAAGGPIGGPFEPASKSYMLTNSSESDPLNWSVTATNGAWLDVDPSSGTLNPGGNVEVVVSVNAAANTLDSGQYDAVITFHNLDSAWLRSVDASLTVAALWFPMDNDPGWEGEGGWAFGAPMGAGGAHGAPDPSAGYSGANVWGYNLAGDYENGLAAPHYLTTTGLDCRNFENVQLQFRRWLGVEKPQYDHASIQVSRDGQHWTDVWTNTAEVVDRAWTLVTYDISSVADHRIIFLRWGIGPTDRTWAYCGWNIDDVALLGAPVPGEGEGGDEGEGTVEGEGEGGGEGEGELTPIDVDFCLAFSQVRNNPLLGQIGDQYQDLLDRLDPAMADINGTFNVDLEGPIIIEVNGNGILDAANELGLLAFILGDPSFNNGVLSHEQVRYAWEQNTEQLINKNIGAPLNSILPLLAAGLSEILVGMITLGDGDLMSVSGQSASGNGSFGIVAGLFALVADYVGALGFGEFNAPTLIKADFVTLENLTLNGDADGDGYTNSEEYTYFTPVACEEKSESPIDYVTAALNPTIYPGFVPEGEGGGEGEAEGEAEGYAEGVSEGSVEGVLEGEGTVEGEEEGVPSEGSPEEGEGVLEGEGTVEGEEEGVPSEGSPEEGEGGVEDEFLTADQDQDNLISLSELLRVIQFFNSGGYHCEAGTEDGYAPGPGDETCAPYDSDYNPQDWEISLSELLRVIQFFNSGGYHACPGEGTEDGFCPGL